MDSMGIELLLPVALIGIMLAVGLGLTLADFQRIVRQPLAFWVGISGQLLLLPALALLIIYAFNLSGELATGLFIISLCPGGTTSNLFSLLAKADIGLSVSLTAVSSLIIPFTLPPLTLWAMAQFGVSGDQFSLPLFETWAKLLGITLIPVYIGMLIRRYQPAIAQRLADKLSAIGVLVIVMAIVLISVEMDGQLIEFLRLAGPAIIALNIVSMLAGVLLGRILHLKQQQIRTLCIEIGLQNSTLALLVTSTLLASMTMSIAPTVYGLIMLGSAGVYTLWARWVVRPRSESVSASLKSATK